jgi:hypothetical protein
VSRDDDLGIISLRVMDEIAENILRKNPYSDLFPSREWHPTRRQRAGWWLRERVERAQTAIAVLRGRHDCGYY